MIKTSVQAVGEGLGVPLPSIAVEKQGLRPGSELEVIVTKDAIMLLPVSKGKSKLDELVAQITDENMHELVDWGRPVGGEVW
jgi:antitoxin MazE